MNPGTKPLAGRHLSLCISGAGSNGSPGYPPAQINALTLQFAQAFLSQGVGVVFGHDWREDGVMESVHAFARQSCAPESGSDVNNAVPLIMNFVPWPDKTLLWDSARQRLKDSLRVTRVALPESLRPFEQQALDLGAASGLYIYLRARGLTELRRALNRVSDARLCIGGPESSSGRYPGIVEEAYLAVRDDIPCYISSLLGGAGAQVADALLQKEMPVDFGRKTKAAAVFLHAPVVDQSLPADDRDFDPAAVWRVFHELGARGLSRQNGLSEEENRELLTTRVVERIVNLVITGLARMKKNSPGPGRAYRG